MNARFVMLSNLLLIACSSTSPLPPAPPSPEEIVWREFVDLLRAGALPSERVRPLQESLREPIIGWLGDLRAVPEAEWTRAPEVFHVGDQVHYLLPLTLNGATTTYTFSFLVSGGRWYFRHLEAISIRLDRLGALPVSDFPDLPEETKAWMRAEKQVTEDVWQYNTIKQEKGDEQALRWFADGAGYALAARVWIPFVPPERAFVLYLCWEQSRLQGNPVTLEQLSDEEAVVRLTPLWFVLYDHTAHLRSQISLADYRKLFEFRWSDRAENAGWTITFSYEADDVVLRLRRAA